MGPMVIHEEPEEEESEDNENHIETPPKKKIKLEKSESDEDTATTLFDYDSASNDDLTSFSEQKPISNAEEIKKVSKSKSPIKVTIEKAGLKQETKPNTATASVSLLKASLLKPKPSSAKIPPLSSLLKQKSVTINKSSKKPKTNILM